MKRHKIDTSGEKHILVNMIIDTNYLAQIKDICKPHLFETNYARIICGWIWEYYNKTEKSPGKDIQDLYQNKKHEIADEDDLELIADFLGSLNEYYQNTEINNLKYELHKAEDYFKLRSLEDLANKLQNTIATRDIAQGEKFVSEYKRIEKPIGAGINILADSSTIKNAFDFTQEYMFRYPGILGEILGYFCRGDFFAILAQVKTGKSFWLMDLAKYSCLFGFKTLLINLEMTDNQLIRRTWQNLVGQPIKPGMQRMPYFHNAENGKWEVKHKDKIYDGLDLSKVEYEQKKIRKQVRTGELRQKTFPSGYADLNVLESYISNLEYYEGFIPDTIIIDYADIIKQNGRDYRHGLNEIWVRLRGWAQDRNCFVATASQTNKSAFSRDAKSADVAEDMRKLATVTKMMSLNQVQEEKNDGILRIEPLLCRDGKVDGRQIVVLENRDIGRPMLNSRIKNDVTQYIKNGGNYVLKT